MRYSNILLSALLAASQRAFPFFSFCYPNVDRFLSVPAFVLGDGLLSGQNALFDVRFHTSTLFPPILTLSISSQSPFVPLEGGRLAAPPPSFHTGHVVRTNNLSYRTTTHPLPGSRGTPVHRSQPFPRCCSRCFSVLSPRPGILSPPLSECTPRSRAPYRQRRRRPGSHLGMSSRHLPKPRRRAGPPSPSPLAPRPSPANPA